MALRSLVLAAVLIASLAVAGCADQTVNAGSVQPSPQGQVSNERRAAAVTFLSEEQPHKGRSRGVVLSTSIGGPANHLRWNAVVVLPNGHVLAYESELGESQALNLLVAPGDYIVFKPYFRALSTENTTVIRKAVI